MQVAHVLAVVDAIEVEVVAGFEATDAQTVEARVGAAADVGDATQGLAQVVGAVGAQVLGLYRVDRLGALSAPGALVRVAVLVSSTRGSSFSSAWRH